MHSFPHRLIGLRGGRWPPGRIYFQAFRVPFERRCWPGYAASGIKLAPVLIPSGIR